MIGKTILHYRILARLGAGGMGEIYKAEDTRLRRPVAIKILSGDMSNDPERRRRFFQEAQAASALNHPNIITLYDIVPEGEVQCIVMEFIDGQTLRDVIPVGGLRAPQALQYAVQIASALSAAHAANIIHRDLKPSNVMVTSSGLVKLLDFGLAKYIGPGITDAATEPGEEPTIEAALTREGSILGTVSYMSPEQAEGRRVDARSDIFSFGSMLYEMVTGKRAFEGRSGISTLTAILRDDVTPVYEHAPDVPPELEHIVLRCLMKDPAARWQSMKELGTALLALQRQLDPSGHYAPPVRTSSLSSAGPAPVEMATTVVTHPPLAKPPSGSQPPSARSASKNVPPSAAPRPSRMTPTGSKAAVKPASKPASNTVVVIALALIGVVVLGAAAAGGWYWWTKMRRPATPTVAVATPTPTPAAPAPAPTPAPAPPPEATPAPTPPSQEAAKQEAAKEEKPKKTRTAKTSKAPVEEPQATAPVPAPAPAPTAPSPAAPPPVATPAPAPVPLPAPRPVVQRVPVSVGDALPFIIILNQDVAADAQEGSPLHFTATEGLDVGGKTVIAKGAMVTGSVMGEVTKKFLGISGGHKLTFRLDQADAVDGKKLSIRAMAGRSQEGSTIRPFETGKGSKSKGFAAVHGTEYIAYIDGDQTVSVNK